jgi:hypothetical protein
MKQLGQDEAYRSAMNAAVEKLGVINEEGIRVSNRMHQLDSLLEALLPFIRSGEQTPVEDHLQIYKPIESAPEPVHANGLGPQMVGSAIPDIVPQRLLESADPIQRRINSVLGLAVA